MRHDARSRLWIVLTGLAVACGHGDASARQRLLASPEALRLVGAWKVRFELNYAVSSRVDVGKVGPITGTVVLAEDRFGRVGSTEIGDATHDGVYDVDFSPFGFSSRSEGDVPAAIARLVPTTLGDSLYIVLSPGTTRLAVVMAGRLAGDSASGEWHASAFSSGGGAGSFTMHRRVPQ
ncbi:MAG: hypothetical protein HOQ29_10725 [Acidobacteria bacterium]|nr:hypothetical protein [Acidobacteriota bacterium]